MVSPGTNGEKEPPRPFPSLGSYPAFLRKITRKSRWDNALRDRDHQTASAVFVEEDNSTSVYLVHDDVELRRIAGVDAYASDANFILFRVANADQVFDGLKRRGVLIKNLHATHPLLANCLRVTVGTPGENAQFLAALTAQIA